MSALNFDGKGSLAMTADERAELRTRIDAAQRLETRIPVWPTKDPRRTGARGGSRHGTEGGYASGCKCDYCMAAMREGRRRRRAAEAERAA